MLQVAGGVAALPVTDHASLLAADDRAAPLVAGALAGMVVPVVAIILVASCNSSDSVQLSHN